MTNISLKRRGTIVGYKGNGKVQVCLKDGTSLTNYDYICDIPVAYSNQSGAFIGGYPEAFTEVYMEQSQGQWTISGYAVPDNVYNEDVINSGVISADTMIGLKPGRLLIQSNNADSKIYLDSIEIHSGNNINYIKQNINDSIINTKFDSKWDLLSSSRSVEGPIRRNVSDKYIPFDSTDISEYRNVGMDNIANVSTITTSDYYRNLQLNESRKVFFEFEEKSDGNSFTNDFNESQKYSSQINLNSYIPLRTDTKDTAFDLNQYAPNKLIEKIEGTGVDNLSNIIDINRSILPIGNSIFGFQENEDKVDAFANIRAIHRKSLAFHFEINTRKSLNNYDVYQVKPASNKEDYSRDRSNFFFDIDKEGQFKINIPMSSEIGNIGLPTRYINASVLAFEQDKIKNPNAYFVNENYIDIFLEDYSNNKPENGIDYRGVSLVDEFGNLAKDRFTDVPIKLNTVYHDITKAGFQFTKERLNDGPIFGFMQGYMSISSRLESIQYENIVAPEIITSGDKANAGGRSGTLNLDGSLNISLGANTVDRQSLWLDTAGGIVSRIGRDKRGISYSSSLDGDLIIQIGGPTIGSSKDSRFSNLNNSNQPGRFDLRILDADGAQASILRFDEKGMTLYTFGRSEFFAQQGMIFRTNGDMLFEAENIGFHYATTPRYIKRNGVPEI